MLRNLRTLYLRFRSSNNYTNDLDAVLNQTDPGAPLFDRLTWLVDLMQWVRFKSYLVDYQEIQNVKLPVVRLRFLLSLLDRNPGWKSRVAETLRSILIDTRDVELFATTGLPEEHGFWPEFFQRLGVKIMPDRPLTEGGIPLFWSLFPNKEDAEWFSQMPPEIMQRLIDLVLHERTSEKSFEPVIEDIEEALLILTSQVRSIGMTQHIRRRVDFGVKDSPFSELTLEVRSLLEARRKGDRDAILRQNQVFQDVVLRCFEAFDQVYSHLDEHGVSLKVVYLLEIGQAKLKRITDLVDLVLSETPNAALLLRFISELIRENQEKHSLRSLFEQNTRLISQKINERNADSGESYITRNRAEYRKMLKKAAGGGAYMAVAVVVKLFLGILRLPEFIQGFIYGINYSLAFVTIQLQGFTVATKQPAMTGPALAAKLDQVFKNQPIDGLVDEIVRMFRSQTAGILGNVWLVIPCTLIFDLIFYLIFGTHMIGSPEKADYYMNGSHLFSFAGVFAAFTGVLLWLSAVMGGYADNWFHLNSMRDTIQFNRRLNYVIGHHNSERIALFLEKNIASLTSNISLGMFLGMVPKITAFLGLYLDVRHVTLSSGNLVLGAVYHGQAVFQNSDFWLSFAGLWVIGILNVAVSFALAFWVALRSRQLSVDKKFEIYKAIFARFRRAPLSFVLPTKET